jgi:hypothetical protein
LRKNFLDESDKLKTAPHAGLFLVLVLQNPFYPSTRSGIEAGPYLAFGISGFNKFQPVGTRSFALLVNGNMHDIAAF